MRRVDTGIFDRLKHGRAANQTAIIRFNSMFGDGKTHTLIALEVWRTGAHYIIKDEYQQLGTTWLEKWTREKIGPTIVEQATCETMMMPRYRNPDGTGAC